MSEDVFVQQVNACISKSLTDNPRGHVTEGFSCLVAHYSEEGEQLPCCLRCFKCLKYIRPEQREEQCNGTHDPYEYVKG
jgi:hypothetical protein